MSGPVIAREECQRLRGEGWKVADLAQRYGVTPKTINKICEGVACPVNHVARRRADITARSRQLKTSVQALLEEGLTHEQAARHLGIHRCSVTRLVGKVEVPAWVPEHLRPVFVDVARREDEHVAASVCRQRKAAEARPCA